jgi:hypothetical protein
MGILCTWKPPFHCANTWFWCGCNCCEKEIVVFCSLGGLKATTGLLKLISRFILIHKSPLVFRVALTFSVRNSRMYDENLSSSFCAKSLFSHCLFPVVTGLEKRLPFWIAFLTSYISMGLHDPCVCVYTTELFMLKTHESHYHSEISDLAMLDMDNPNLEQLIHCLMGILHA